LFKLELNDTNTDMVLDECSKHDLFAGWGILRTDDRVQDILYACPRFYEKSDLPLRSLESYFTLDNGTPEKLKTEDIDFNNIPARMMALVEYDYVFKNQPLSP
jgi:hypothetical protein